MFFFLVAIDLGCNWEVVKLWSLSILHEIYLLFKVLGEPLFVSLVVNQ